MSVETQKPGQSGLEQSLSTAALHEHQPIISVGHVGAHLGSTVSLASFGSLPRIGSMNRLSGSNTALTLSQTHLDAALGSPRIASGSVGEIAPTNGDRPGDLKAEEPSIPVPVLTVNVSASNLADVFDYMFDQPTPHTKSETLLDHAYDKDEVTAAITDRRTFFVPEEDDPPPAVDTVEDEEALGRPLDDPHHRKRRLVNIERNLYERTKQRRRLNRAQPGIAPESSIKEEPEIRHPPNEPIVIPRIAPPEGMTTSNGGSSSISNAQAGQTGVLAPPKRPKQNHVCTNCYVTETPRWRYCGPDPKAVLCNACGLFYTRNQSMRPVFEAMPSNSPAGSISATGQPHGQANPHQAVVEAAQQSLNAANAMAAAGLVYPGGAAALYPYGYPAANGGMIQPNAYGAQYQPQIPLVVVPTGEAGRNGSEPFRLVTLGGATVPYNAFQQGMQGGQAVLQSVAEMLAYARGMSPSQQQQAAAAAAVAAAAQQQQQQQSPTDAGAGAVLAGSAEGVSGSVTGDGAATAAAAAVAASQLPNMDFASPALAHMFDMATDAFGVNRKV